MKSEIGCFTADFRGNKVLVGNKTFPSGYYFTDALNEYWKEAPAGVNSNTNGDWLIANRLSSMHLFMWNIQEDIVAGYLDENSAEKLHDSIKYILRVIRKARPFMFLDLKAETKRCDALFGTESVRRINRILQDRAKYALKTDNIPRPNTSDMRRYEEEQVHFNDYVSTLDYYYKLSDDMIAAHDFGKGFVTLVASLEKRDESHLIQCAMECLAKVPFSRWSPPFLRNASPNIEYLPMPKKPTSVNYVVGKRMTFTRFMDFLVVDFFEGLHAGHYPLLCENCGRYYLKTNARFQKYCIRADPNDKWGRTCQAVAAAKGRAAKEKHPLKHPYTTRLKTIRTHINRGKITEVQATIAKRLAIDCYDRALMDPDYADTQYLLDIGQDMLYKSAGINL
jgi:hypothetical protein